MYYRLLKLNVKWGKTFNWFHCIKLPKVRMHQYSLVPYIFKECILLCIYIKPSTQQISNQLITTFVSVVFINCVKIMIMFRLTWNHLLKYCIVIIITMDPYYKLCYTIIYNIDICTGQLSFIFWLYYNSLDIIFWLY
jgi:hypothetical protein